jgi:hypothetical protein
MQSDETAFALLRKGLGSKTDGKQKYCTGPERKPQQREPQR